MPTITDFAKPKQFRTLSWEEIDASLAIKPLTGSEVPHLDTKSLFAKLD